jgi:hypothetical protein
MKDTFNEDVSRVSMKDTFEPPLAEPIKGVEASAVIDRSRSIYQAAGRPPWLAPIVLGQGQSMEDVGLPTGFHDVDKTRKEDKELKWVQGKDSRSIIDKGIDAIVGIFGSENVRKMSEGAKAQALVTYMAKQEGLPVDRYRQTPAFLEHLSASFIDMTTFGLAPAIKKSLTGEEEYTPSSTAGYIGTALGSLAGLYAGPIQVASKVMNPIISRAPTAFQEDVLVSRVLKSALRDSLLLGPALGMVEFGEALEQTSFRQAAGKIWEGVKSGVSIGSIFGASRGLFPKEGWQTGARIFTGLLGLNTYRAVETGGNPFTDRPVGDVLFDIALDSVFLYKALPKNMRFEVAKDLETVNDRIEKNQQEEATIDNIPDQAIQIAKAKAVEAEKQQIELEAKKIAEKAAAGIEAKATVETKSEKIKKAKGEPDLTVFQRMPDEELKKMADKGVEGAKGEIKRRNELLKDQGEEVVKEEEEIPIVVQREGEVPDDLRKRLVEGEYTDEEVDLMSLDEAKEALNIQRDANVDIQSYAGKVGQNKHIKGIQLIGSSVEGKGKDIDILYDFGNVKLPKGNKAISKIERLIESTKDLDLDLYDTFVKVGDRYFHISSGAGREVIENTKYGKEQEGKSSKVLYSEEIKKEVPKKDFVVDSDTDEVINKEEVVKKEKVAKKKKAPYTEVEEQTGSKPPVELEQDNHPFRNSNVEETNVMRSRFQPIVNQGHASPEVFTSYLVNEVNRYLNGEDVNIGKVRDGLSELAARADNLDKMFDRKKDFKTWKDTVSEAAKWARESDRSKNKRTGDVQLNIMIPVDQIPNMVKDVFKGIKATFGETIHRNKEIFDKTGYWLGKDGKWRYEVDDSKLMINADLLKPTDEPYGRHKLEDIVKQPKLYKAVPELKDYNIKLDRTLEGESGHYESDTKTIVVGSPNRRIVVHELQHAVNDIVGSKFRGTNIEYEKRKKIYNTLSQMRRIVIDPEIKRDIEDAIASHLNNPKWSIEQLISHTEILAYDKSPVINGLDDYSRIREALRRHYEESAAESYMKDPGEMEARLTEQRMNISAENKKKIPPWITLDIMLENEGITKPIDFSREGKPYYPSMGTAGTKLYSGFPIDEATKILIKSGRKIAEYTKQARGMKEFRPKEASEMLREEFNRSFIDRHGNIRIDLLDKLGNEGYEVVQLMYLSKGAPALSAEMLKQMRKEYLGGLSKDDKKILDDIILAARMMDIGKYKTDKEFKFPTGKTPQDFADYLMSFKYKDTNMVRDLTDTEAYDLYHIDSNGKIGGRAGAYFDWMKKPLEDMKKDLITQDEYDALVSHNYRKIKLVEIYDKSYQSKIGKKPRTIYDSGIEPLAKGRDTDIYEPSSEIMALEVFNRAYGRILNNEANKSLLDLARKDKENPFVRYKESPKDKIPSGWNRIFVYEEGERKAIYLSPEMSKEWITGNPEMSYRLGQFLRYASGSPVLRTFATGIDWGFAVANLPRDIMHAWFTARQFDGKEWKNVYNPNLPIFGLQIGNDLRQVFDDAVNRKGRYEQYIKEGGGMEFLVHQGRLFQRGRHIESGIDKVYDVLGYFGETSEIMTRLAIRERVIKNRAREKGISFEEANADPKITREATFAARDYMDFGQGGSIAKALDNGIPYLNAAIQGTRGLTRAFKPGSGTALMSTWKLAQFAAVVTGVYLANQFLNPKTMEALRGNVDMQNNLIIPLGDGFSFQDEKGQTRYPYFKIPLDPGQKFFKTVFEGGTDKWLGRPVDTSAIKGAFEQISPVGVSSMPPTVSGTLGYFTNKDFWLNEDIWKKTDKPFEWPKSKEEYIPGQTPQLFTDIGKATGLSPERTKYAVEELITGGSMWGYIVGQGYEVMFGDLPKDKKEKHLAEVMSKVPVVRRFLGVTNPYSQYAQDINEAKMDSSLQRFVENRGLDTLVEGYLFKDNVSREEIDDYISKTAKDKDTFDRLRERFKFQEKIKDLPNRSFWLSLKGIPDSKARAEVYVRRFVRATPDEQDQIRDELGIVTAAGGVVSSDFRREVDKIMSEK